MPKWFDELVGILREDAIANAQVELVAQRATQLNIAEGQGGKGIGNRPLRECGGCAAGFTGQQSQQCQDVAAAERGCGGGP
jgi:hypothetical protein